MVWADLYIGADLYIWDKSKLNKSTVGIAVDNIVSPQTTVFSLEVNITGFDLLASTVSVCSLAKFNNIIIGIFLAVALDNESIVFFNFFIYSGRLFLCGRPGFLDFRSRSFNSGCRFSCNRSGFCFCFFNS